MQQFIKHPSMPFHLRKCPLQVFLAEQTTTLGCES